jgi:Bacterial pre-peptidase C-terminal domain/CARDB
MPSDLAGNSLVSARNITTNSSVQTFTDYVGATDLNDYYTFTLSTKSSFNLSLSGLSADANVEMLDSTGATIPTIPASINTGTTAESINTILNSGTYYIRVYPGAGTPSTYYDLNIQAKTAPPDILWRNYSTGQNIAWFMNGTTVGGYTDITPVGDVNWRIEGTGDFNGDGQTDILWRNYSTGQNIAWFMNGTTVGGYTDITPVGDVNWQIAGTFSSTQVTPIDLAGNDTTTAFNVGILNGDGTYTDTVDSSDLDDYYKFTLLSISDVDLFLDGLSGDANVEILDSNGNLVGISTNSGTTSESISLVSQVAGTYYVRVYSTGESTSYNLNLIGNSGTPDIISSSLSLTNLSNNPLTSIIVGQKFKVNFNVQNTGTGSSSNISSPFNVAFYISKDATIDTSDYQLHLGSNSAVVGDYTIASLNAGASTGTLTQTLILPPANNPFWDTAGTYYIGMIVDSGDAIGETSETNNSNLGLDVDFATTSVILQDIDLVGVTSGFNLKTLSNTTMTKGFAGQQFTADFQIQNTGMTDTNAAFTVAFYISTDSQIDAADKLLGTYDITDFSSLIAGGNTGTLTKSLTLPPIGDAFWNGVLSADYYIGMLIDSGDTVFETTETNNSSVAVDTDYVKVKISQNAVDLVGETFQDQVSGFAVSDQDTSTAEVDVSAGAAFDFSFSLKNIGNTAANPFKVAFYISTDNKYDAGTDRLLTASSDPETTYYYDITSLGAGASTGLLSLTQTLGNALILPGIADDFWSQGNGTYYIGMVIDPNLDDPESNGIVGDIDEVDELNNYSRDDAANNVFTDLDINYAAVNVTGISGIDLKGNSFNIGGVSNASAGTVLTATYQIENSGVSDITSSFRVGFYLSSDGTITTNDTFLGSSIISSLGGKQVSGSLTKNLTIPSGLAAGTYYLGMFIDSLGADNGGQIAEKNDSNRTSGGVWTVGNNSSVGDGIDFKSINIS